MTYSRFNQITVESVIKAYNRMSYPIFTKGDYNLNIFGIRNMKNVDANTFNDLIGLLYKVNGDWVLKKYDATTDPGTKFRTSPVNIHGTAILKEGYHRHGFKLGYHKGSYEALQQNRPLPLYRDNNKDSHLDYDSPVIVEMAGINIHRGRKHGTTELVGPWSAGCQVIANSDDFDEFMTIVKKSAKIYGKTFSYALFTETQFFA